MRNPPPRSFQIIHHKSSRKWDCPQKGQQTKQPKIFTPSITSQHTWRARWILVRVFKCSRRRYVEEVNYQNDRKEKHKNPQERLYTLLLLLWLIFIHFFFFFFKHDGLFLIFYFAFFVLVASKVFRLCSNDNHKHTDHTLIQSPVLQQVCACLC